MINSTNVVQFMINQYNYVCGSGSGSGPAFGGPEGFKWVTPTKYPEAAIWERHEGEFKYDPDTNTIYRNEPEYDEKTAEGLVYNGLTNTWSHPETEQPT